MLNLKSCYNNRGYLLLEAVVSVAVIAIGLAIILRSFASSLRASKISQEYFIAALLLNDKLCDLEEKIKIKGGIDNSDAKEEKTPDTKYITKTDVMKLDELDSLADVKTVVSWNSGKRNERIEVDTFMQYKK